MPTWNAHRASQAGCHLADAPWLMKRCGLIAAAQQSIHGQLLVDLSRRVMVGTTDEQKDRWQPRRVSAQPERCLQAVLCVCSVANTGRGNASHWERAARPSLSNDLS